MQILGNCGFFLIVECHFKLFGCPAGIRNGGLRKSKMFAFKICNNNEDAASVFVIARLNFLLSVIRSHRTSQPPTQLIKRNQNIFQEIIPNSLGFFLFVSEMRGSNPTT